MTRSAARLVLTAICAIALTTPALAKAEPETTQAQEISPEAAQAQETKDSIADLIGTLDSEQTGHFMKIYTNHNIIQTVTIIREDVGNAVAACGENNPDMKTELKQRFTKWSEEIDPIIEEAESFLSNMIVAQDYADKDRIETLLDQADRTRDAYRDKFKKVPVTSEEGCTFLLNKMDDTQQELTSLLKSTLLRPAAETVQDDSDEEAAAAEEEEEEQETPDEGEQTEDEDTAEEESEN